MFYFLSKKAGAIGVSARYVVIILNDERMEEQLLDEAIEKCLAEDLSMAELLDVLNLAQLIIA